MAVLYFTGDQVAFFSSIDDRGSATRFSEVEAPFQSTDIVEIDVPDQYIQSSGEFRTDEVQFASVTVIRDGVRHEFQVDSGSKIKETGGSNIKEAGDTFFTTNDSVGPPNSGPFSGLETEKMVFSTDAIFTTGQTTDIKRKSHEDHNDDGDTKDAGEKGNRNFNAKQADTMPCYTPGTLIETDQGQRPVETLRAGDRVATLDHGFQPIRWVRAGVQSLDSLEPDRKPVLIAQGALGAGLPKRPLIVSPQHRVLVGGRGQLEHIFEREVFVPAKSLTRLPGIRHMQGKRFVQWLHFACASHEVVWANGCLSESLLLGPMVLRQLPRTEQSRLRALFPAEALSDPSLNGPPARPCLAVQEARQTCLRARQTHSLHLSALDKSDLASLRASREAA